MMRSASQQLLAVISILFCLICIVHCSQANADDQRANDQALANARFQTMQQLLSRRGLYDPAFGDSWSNYFEKKRALFDPAYSDWANSFKRSDD